MKLVCNCDLTSWIRMGWRYVGPSDHPGYCYVEPRS